MLISVGEQTFNLRVAKQEDLDNVLGLLVNAAEWLKSKGTTQWDYYISDLKGNTQEVLDSIKNEATFLLEEDGELVASVTLEDEPNEWDLDIWGPEGKRKNVFYLHRLVVQRSMKGRGIGTALLEWAEEYARNKGKSIIRFDCLASNEGLNKYYQSKYELKEIANIYGQHSKYEIIC